MTRRDTAYVATRRARASAVDATTRTTEPRRGVGGSPDADVGVGDDDDDEPVAGGADVLTLGGAKLPRLARPPLASGDVAVASGDPIAMDARRREDDVGTRSGASAEAEPRSSSPACAAEWKRRRRACTSRASCQCADEL